MSFNAFEVVRVSLPLDSCKKLNDLLVEFQKNKEKQSLTSETGMKSEWVDNLNNTFRIRLSNSEYDELQDFLERFLELDELPLVNIGLENIGNPFVAPFQLPPEIMDGTVRVALSRTAP